MRQTSAQELVTILRGLLAEESGRYFPTTVLLRFLSAAQHVVAQIYQATNVIGLRKTYDITLVADQAEYDLPPDLLYPDFLAEIDSNGDFTSRIYGFGADGYMRSGDQTFDIVNGKLVIYPTPTASLDLRLVYRRVLPDLTIGQFGSGCTTTSLQLATSDSTDNEYTAADVEDDAYNGITFEILSGNLARTRFTVDDYTGQTAVATLSTALSQAPAQGDVYTSCTPFFGPAAMLMCLCALQYALARAVDERPVLLQAMTIQGSIMASLGAGGPEAQPVDLLAIKEF